MTSSSLCECLWNPSCQQFAALFYQLNLSETKFWKKYCITRANDPWNGWSHMIIIVLWIDVCNISLSTLLQCIRYEGGDVTRWLQLIVSVACWMLIIAAMRCEQQRSVVSYESQWLGWDHQTPAALLSVELEHILWQEQEHIWCLNNTSQLWIDLITTLDNTVVCETWASEKCL